MFKELSINLKKINFSGSIGLGGLGGTSSAGKKEFLTPLASLQIMRS